MKANKRLITVAEVEAMRSEIGNLRAAIGVLLDCVDYTGGACSATEMVGAVLPKEVIASAKKTRGHKFAWET